MYIDMKIYIYIYCTRFAVSAGLSMDLFAEALVANELLKFWLQFGSCWGHLAPKVGHKVGAGPSGRGQGEGYLAKEKNLGL